MLVPQEPEGSLCSMMTLQVKGLALKEQKKLFYLLSGILDSIIYSF